MLSPFASLSTTDIVHQKILALVQVLERDLTLAVDGRHLVVSATPTPISAMSSGEDVFPGGFRRASTRVLYLARVPVYPVYGVGTKVCDIITKLIYGYFFIIYYRCAVITSNTYWFKRQLIKVHFIKFVYIFFNTLFLISGLNFLNVKRVKKVLTNPDFFKIMEIY